MWLLATVKAAWVLGTRMLLRVIECAATQQGEVEECRPTVLAKRR